MIIARAVTAGDGTVVGWNETGQGEALLLVHAAAADARQWSRLVPFLADAFTVMAMDRRGRGASGPMKPDHSLETDVGDVVAVAASVTGQVHLSATRRERDSRSTPRPPSPTSPA